MTDDHRRPLELWEDPAFAAPDEPVTPPAARPDATGYPGEVELQPPDVGRSSVETPNLEPELEPASVPITLDPLQLKAIEDARTHIYTNISGTAGVGKTFVAQEILARNPGVVLAATTGIASVNLGTGTTINALLRYFDTQSLEDMYRDGYLKTRIQKLRRAGVQRILIDEKSMMNADQLTYITRAVREVNEGKIEGLEDVGMSDDDFGVEDVRRVPKRDVDLPPIGITLVGDFGQLPPVPDKDPKTGRNKKVMYAFDSPEWPAYAEHTTRLETIYRQDARDFVTALHAVRRGDVTTAMSFFTPDRFSQQLDTEFNGSTIFAKNDAVERHNLMMMDKLPGTPVEARAIREGKQRGDWKQIPDVLRLKPGALVMVLANKRVYEDEDDREGRLLYCNGDLGILNGPYGEGWSVKLHRTGLDTIIYPCVRENTIPLEVGRRKEITEAWKAGTGPDPATVITEMGKGRQEIIGTITYMPLRAAYGCTVHKTQGLTLDAVQVNIRDPFFRMPGMLFVALSRCRTAEGLRIVGEQRGFLERCRIEPRVQPWL